VQLASETPRRDAAKLGPPSRVTRDNPNIAPGAWPRALGPVGGRCGTSAKSAPGRRRRRQSSKMHGAATGAVARREEPRCRDPCDGRSSRRGRGGVTSTSQGAVERTGAGFAAAAAFRSRIYAVGLFAGNWRSQRPPAHATDEMTHSPEAARARAMRACGGQVRTN